MIQTIAITDTAFSVGGIAGVPSGSAPEKMREAKPKVNLALAWTAIFTPITYFFFGRYKIQKRIDRQFSRRPILDFDPSFRPLMGKPGDRLLLHYEIQ